MRPTIAVLLGAVVFGPILGATAAGTEPAVYRPPEEARFRPVILPSNSPMTPAGPLAATPLPELLGARGFALADEPLPDEPLPEDLGPLPGDPDSLPASPAPTATPRPTPRPTRAPNAWRYDPEASWYGPGFYGKRTACGLAMTRTLLGVAHRSLPCGTLITFRHAGRTLTVPVVDRGPYVDGRTWDLTAAAAIALDHLWTGPIEWRFR